MNSYNPQPNQMYGQQNYYPGQPNPLNQPPANYPNMGNPFNNQPNAYNHPPQPNPFNSSGQAPSYQAVQHFLCSLCLLLPFIREISQQSFTKWIIVTSFVDFVADKQAKSLLKRLVLPKWFGASFFFWCVGRSVVFLSVWINVKISDTNALFATIYLVIVMPPAVLDQPNLMMSKDITSITLIWNNPLFKSLYLSQ